MMNVDITRKNGEVAKTIKVPMTVAGPIMYGAVCAGMGAAVGVVAGFMRGVWEDGKTLLKKK